MKFTIKAGRKTANNKLSMRFNPGLFLEFGFKLGKSCLYSDSGIIDGQNRIFGVTIPGTFETCDLVFIKDRSVLTLDMIVNQYTFCGRLKKTNMRRLVSVQPDLWYYCLITKTTLDEGKWGYVIQVNGIDDSHFIPYQSRMYSSCARIPLMFLRHPKLGGRYTLENDCDIEIKFVN